MPESPGRAQRWEVYVDGEPMGFRLDAKGAPQPDRARLTRMQAHLGMVFQQFNLWPHLSVLGLVIEAPMQVGRLSRAEPRRGANPHPFRLGLCGRTDVRAAVHVLRSARSFVSSAGLRHISKQA